MGRPVSGTPRRPAVAGQFSAKNSCHAKVPACISVAFDAPLGKSGGSVGATGGNGGAA